MSATTTDTAPVALDPRVVLERACETLRKDAKSLSDHEISVLAARDAEIGRRALFARWLARAQEKRSGPSADGREVYFRTGPRYNALLLTDGDLVALHGFDAAEAEKWFHRREAALAGPAPQTGAPGASATSTPQPIRMAHMREGETLEEFFERCQSRAVPLYLFKVLFEFAHAMNEKNVLRNARIDALEQQQPATSNDVVQQLERRIAALEAQPRGLTFRGAFVDGTTYERGDVVQWGGGMFVCKRATSANPDAFAGKADAPWQLGVARGREGKQGPPGQCRCAGKP